MASALHQCRLETVTRYLLDSGARRVLDLGCGGGELLQRLRDLPQFHCIVGIDIDQRALLRARGTLGLSLPTPNDRLQVRLGSFEDCDRSLCGFDAAVLLETIEHIQPQRLSRVEHAVFASMRPRCVLVTTPNQEYNVLHGMQPGQRRHPGHRFEWPRCRFRQWANGVADRHGYTVAFVDIGPPSRRHGSSTQMAQFTLGQILDPVCGSH